MQFVKHVSTMLFEWHYTTRWVDLQQTAKKVILFQIDVYSISSSSCATSTELYSNSVTRINLIPVKEHVNVGSDYESS